MNDMSMPRYTIDFSLDMHKRLDIPFRGSDICVVYAGYDKELNPDVQQSSDDSFQLIRAMTELQAPDTNQFVWDAWWAPLPPGPGGVLTISFEAKVMVNWALSAVAASAPYLTKYAKWKNKL